MAARQDQASANPAEEASRKRRIMAAANELLDEDGLEGLTIRAVLKRSSLARRAFYERFAGKDDLVLAVFEQTLAEAAAFFADAVAALPSPLDRLRHVVMGLVNGALDDGTEFGARRVSAIVREHMRLAEARPAELEKALRPLLGVMAEQIAEGIAAGQLRAVDPALHATMIYNIVATTIHPDLLAGGSDRLAGERRLQLAEEIWEFCRRGIIA